MINNLKTEPKGLLVAGLSGGSGKSVVAVGITAALAEQGLRIAPFKKGPDYIDAGWLQMAAGNECHNLDPYLMPAAVIKQSFREHSRGKNLAVVEGNRGLFDGVDMAGSYSTAELAAMLEVPVLLSIDCTKTTRTVAAMVLGCQQLGANIDILAVVLNRIGSARHERVVRQAVEYYTDVKVVGAIPRLERDIFPQRHIGITPCPEFAGAPEAIHSLARLIGEHVDLGLVAELARPIPTTDRKAGIHDIRPDCGAATTAVTIGVIRDAAFQFYYPENLRALELCGANLVEINALTMRALPEIDGLYIGGGFPETSVRELAANTSFRYSVKDAIEQGLPVYAECGGLIYLGESLEVDGDKYPLAGVFPVQFEMMQKPQAHGYTIIQALSGNPF
ncbi:MAG: cobyrinate a,c-diamide synthase, partial [Deltaproteobacteria bacterium]|nr:cobyrinate a,c-diamide synthase [Deltaproteobacteria bacterium]